jgi:hypothetical protein
VHPEQGGDAVWKRRGGDTVRGGDRGRGGKAMTGCHFREADAAPGRPGFTARRRLVGPKQAASGRE